MTTVEMLRSIAKQSPRRVDSAFKIPRVNGVGDAVNCEMTLGIENELITAAGELEAAQELLKRCHSALQTPQHRERAGRLISDIARHLKGAW